MNKYQIMCVVGMIASGVLAYFGNSTTGFGMWAVIASAFIGIFSLIGFIVSSIN